MRPRSPRLATTMPTKILPALHAQTVVVPGTDAFGRVIAGVAAQQRDVRVERDTLAAELEAGLEALPPGQRHGLHLRVLGLGSVGVATRHLVLRAAQWLGTSRSGPSAAQSLGGAEGVHMDCETVPSHITRHIRWVGFHD